MDFVSIVVYFTLGRQRSNPSSYDEYLKAYSVAMLPGRERENLSYGGKSEPPNSSSLSLTDQI